MLEAGLDGIEHKIEPAKAVDRNIYAMTRDERLAEGIDDLPSSLREALHELKNNSVMLGALGNHIIQNFITSKTMEFQSFQKHVSEWEVEKYFKSY